MALSANEMIKKINFVRSARNIHQRGMITEYPLIPTNPEQEKEVVRDLLFSYLKGKFPGCRIRPANVKFSIRLDNDIHKKAKKLREVVLNHQEWRRWFESNHSSILREINQANNAFRGSTSVFEYIEEEGNAFIHVPFELRRIYGYNQDCLMSIMQYIDNEYRKDERLSNIYERTVNIMEAEIARRNQARQDRLTREHSEYLAGVRSRLIKTVNSSQFDRNGITFEDKFLAKVYDYCTARGIQPQYAEEVTYDKMLPVGTSVRIMAREGERDQDWYAVPMFGGYETPEGFQLRDRWGKITAHDASNTRSRNGAAPLVLENYIYTAFDQRFWQHTIPQEHADLIEMSRQLRAEAQVEADEARLIWEAGEAEREAARQAEATRLRAEREERDRLRREQEQREKEERLEREREQLRQRLEQMRAEPVPTPAPAQPVSEMSDDELIEELFEGEEEPQPEPQRYTQAELDAQAALRAQLGQRLNHQSDQMLQQLNQLRHTMGAYRNSRGIPLERFVLVDGQGNKQFFREVDEIRAASHQMGLTGDKDRYIYDYWNTTTPVEYLRRS
jgi:hypothetical protein